MKLLKNQMNSVFLLKDERRKTHEIDSKKY